MRKCAPGSPGQELQRGAVRVGELAGDVQAEAGASRPRREERLEDLAAQLRRECRGRRRRARRLSHRPCSPGAPAMRMLPSFFWQCCQALRTRFQTIWFRWPRSNITRTSFGISITMALGGMFSAWTISSISACMNSPSVTTSGCWRSRRFNCSTSPTMRSMRFALLRIMPRSRAPAGGTAPSSSRSCAAWLIADSGLRTSCAIDAVRRPSAASFICCASFCARPRSSR